MQRNSTFLLFLLIALLLTAAIGQLLWTQSRSAENPKSYSQQTLQKDIDLAERDLNKRKEVISEKQFSSLQHDLEQVRQRLLTMKGVDTVEEIRTMKIIMSSLEDIQSDMLRFQEKWPPLDSNGKIIPGPIEMGTAEQMGWPMYGYSEEEYRKHQIAERKPLGLEYPIAAYPDGVPRSVRDKSLRR